jgi:hypothetical protein
MKFVYEFRTGICQYSVSFVSIKTLRIVRHLGVNEFLSMPYTFDSAVLVVPNVKVRMEAQHSISRPLSDFVTGKV